MRTNEFGQAIGDALPEFTPGRLPAIERIEGRYTVIERLSKEKHGADLYQVYGPDSPAAMWTFLFKGPARNEEEWDRLLDDLMTAQGRFYYAIVDKDWQGFGDILSHADRSSQQGDRSRSSDLLISTPKDTHGYGSPVSVSALRV